MSRHGRRDVVTALALVMMLALGAAFLSRTTQYEPEIYSLLFGMVLGVSTTQILPVAVMAAACIAAVAVIYGRSCSPRSFPRWQKPVASAVTASRSSS